MPTNRSLWQDEPGIPGIIRESPIPELEDDRVLVKTTLPPFITYPIILGQDVAGTVAGAGATASVKFNVGARIFGFSCNNGFQEYVILDYNLAAIISQSLSFAEASVFPLCVTTSSFGLFGKDYLALPYPSLNPVPAGKTIVIWGGNSSVGSNAIQLAKTAGLEVYTTCSPRSFEYVKSLGADRVFDYNHASAIDDLTTELDNSPSPCAGIYLAAGQVSHKSKQKIPVASSNPIMPGDTPEGVEAKFTFSDAGAEGMKETLAATFGGFLLEALDRVLYKVAPAPEVVSREGLEGIPKALDVLKNGVSASKVVILSPQQPIMSWSFPPRA
ncbi:hypothetical protein BDW62DRAFT_211840 [Aspergillus aurantiobrunneus]